MIETYLCFINISLLSFAIISRPRSRADGEDVRLKLTELRLQSSTRAALV